jgi:hypothetical protein
LAAIPRRPAWQDSDPRWRRRILAGVWLLVLVPLMDALKLSGWASRVPVPSLFDSRTATGTLDRTLLADSLVYRPLIFCIGVVLLFAKEQGRRPHPLDWTRRWGVICSYVVALLSTAIFLLIAALVFVSITAVFQSMPLKHEPWVTPWFLNVSTAYLYYGLDPQGAAGVVLTASASIAVLLACVPLSDALRSSGSRRFWAMLLAPLALFSLMHLAQAVRYCMNYPRRDTSDVFLYGSYFWPEVFIRPLAGLSPTWATWGSERVAVVVEATKWCIVLAIAVWLSIAQRTTRRQAAKTNAA